MLAERQLEVNGRGAFLSPFVASGSNCSPWCGQELGRFGAVWGALGAVGRAGALVRSGALRGLLGRSGASWGVLERCGALWAALWVRWRVLGCSGALWGGRSGALWDALEYSGALWGALGRPEVFDKVTT